MTYANIQEIKGNVNCVPYGHDPRPSESVTYILLSFLYAFENKNEHYGSGCLTHNCIFSIFLKEKKTFFNYFQIFQTEPLEYFDGWIVYRLCADVYFNSKKLTYSFSN